jgi:hypothetical protein
MALAAQKFVTDIAQDAYQYCKIRQQGLTARDKRMAGRVSIMFALCTVIDPLFTLLFKFSLPGDCPSLHVFILF